jgi:hypothetical protein
MTEPASVVPYEERDDVAFIEVIRDRDRSWGDYGERPR